MPHINIRIFVSSTWLDLQPERQSVETVVNRMRETKFVGMEYFGSRDENTQRASLDEVDHSQVYIGVFAGRYGSGITEDEYRRARELKLPCFIYFKRETEIPTEWRENDWAKIAKLVALKEELRRNHTVTEFDSTDDLGAKVASDLHRWLFDQYLQPQLEQAAQGVMPRDQARILLNAIKDTDALDAKLLSRVRQMIVNGERNIAVIGDICNSIIVPGDRNIINVPPAPVFNPLHQLPSPPHDFTGRTKELGELLASIERGSIIAGLHGLGGIGKTALALKLADAIKGRYPDAQFYLDLRGISDNPLTSAEAMARVIRAYHPTERLPESEPELQLLYRSVLHGQRALLLMDNASDDAQVRPLIPPASCLLLVTSRRHFTLPQMPVRRLGALLPEDAVELLRKVASRIRDWEGYDAEIAAVCGHLPLALRAAGSLLESTMDLRPTDYAQQLRDERARLETIGAEGVDYGVEASFNLSYKCLTPERARVYRKLAVFGGSFGAEAEEAVCEDAGHKRLSELVRLSLVEFDDETKCYHLHELARLFTGAKLSDEERREAQRQHAYFYARILVLADNLYLKGNEAIERGLSMFDLERINILTGQAWAELNAEEDDGALLCASYPLIGVNIIDLRLHVSERIRWGESAIKAARRLSRRDAEGALTGNLGRDYTTLGQPQKAIELLEQQLSIARELNDRESESNALGNIGIAYKALGNTFKAIEYYEQQLAITREIQYRKGEGIALCNLGSAYRSLGEIQTAVEFDKESLVVFSGLGDQRSVGSVLGNLGNSSILLGETEQAVKFYEQYLATSRKMGDRSGESIALGNLGQAHLKLGDPQKAIELQNQRLIIAREINDPSGEGTALFNSGLAYWVLGNQAQAITYVEAALSVLEQIESPHAEKIRQQLAEWRQQS